MKKLFALLMALVMSLSLAACGGTDETVESTPAGADTAESVVSNNEESAVALTDNNGNEVTEDTIAALTEAYNAVAVPYNEIATAANENGWMADDQTAAEINAMGQTLGFVGAALTEDLSMLDGTDFAALIQSLESEVPGALDILAERVAVPYEG